MFKNILLPLDGSKLAETAIPVAQYFCHKLSAEIMLLHIIEKDAPKEIHGQNHLATEDEAVAYLEKTRAEFFKDCPGTRSHVHSEATENLSSGIVEHSGELSPDLIIMSAHGEGGLRDFVVGSIAQQVIANGNVPVILLKPGEKSGIATFQIENILVPTDGEIEHEQSITVSKSLAEELSASLHLVRVVPTITTLGGSQAATSTFLPTTTDAYLEIAEEDACEYLQSMLDDLRSAGLRVTAEVRRGDPATEVVESAEENNSDLIVLGTHGKSGMDAFWSASTAPKILSKTRRPVLLYPVRRK